MFGSLLALAFAAAVSGSHPAALVGLYDGNQMEMAAGLELKADGRFRYGLAYGALDEEAEGTWRAEGDHVVLTSDPVTPPRILFLGQQSAAPGTLRISLEAPHGLTPQLFVATLGFAHSETTGEQLADDGLLRPIDPKDPPTSVRLSLPMFELSGDPVAIDPAKGYGLRFRFEPHDIGKVDFRANPLPIDKGDLLLDRHDRTIRFHRIKAP